MDVKACSNANVGLLLVPICMSGLLKTVVAPTQYGVTFYDQEDKSWVF